MAAFGLQNSEGVSACNNTVSVVLEPEIQYLNNQKPRRPSSFRWFVGRTLRLLYLTLHLIVATRWLLTSIISSHDIYTITAQGVVLYIFVVLSSIRHSLAEWNCGRRQTLYPGKTMHSGALGIDSRHLDTDSKIVARKGENITGLLWQLMTTPWDRCGTYYYNRL